MTTMLLDNGGNLISGLIDVQDALYIIRRKPQNDAEKALVLRALVSLKHSGMTADDILDAADRPMYPWEREAAGSW